MNDGLLNVVDGKLFYGVDDGIMPVNETKDTITKIPTYSGNFNPQIKGINNGRTWHKPFNIDVHGFELISHKTQVKNFLDIEELETKYYDEIKTLIKYHIHANKVHIFDHTVRIGDKEKRKKMLLREPVKRVHNDYTDWSGPERLRNLFPNDAESLLSRRFCIIQVWRPIQDILEKDPLALCDARSVVDSDLIIAERRYPDRVGQTYQVKYNENHEWFYFPKMTRDEAIIFKVYESEIDGRARFTPHTSFEDPTTPKDSLPRESIEVRGLVFFD